MTDYAGRSGFEIVAIFRETGSGVKNDRVERKKIIELARNRKVDLLLVSERSRWGRSTSDLRNTVERLAECNVALRALNGPELDISTTQGKLMLNLLASISEFERDLLREGIKSGVAHARSKGTKTGKAIGFRKRNEAERLLAEGYSIRFVAAKLGVSKTTIMKVKSSCTTK